MITGRTVKIPTTSGTHIVGDLFVPDHASGLIIFAHGSGSSRHSPRNRVVAEMLQHAGFATLLVDLLTVNEEGSDNMADVFASTSTSSPSVCNWHNSRPNVTSRRRRCRSGTSGRAPALSSRRHVSRIGSRRSCRAAAAPTSPANTSPRSQRRPWLIVGSLDDQVVEFNRTASEQFRVECRLELVAGATHLFEEPGTLNVVATLARDWFEHWLPAPAERCRTRARDPPTATRLAGH